MTHESEQITKRTRHLYQPNQPNDTLSEVL